MMYIASYKIRAQGEITGRDKADTIPELLEKVINAVIKAETEKGFKKIVVTIEEGKVVPRYPDEEQD